MKRLVIATLSSAVLASSAFAEYQVEANLNWVQNDYMSGILTLDQINVGGIYYINMVNDAEGPLAEAGFLSQVSNIYGSYTDLSLDISGTSTGGDALMFGGEYIDQQSGLIVGGKYLKQDADNDAFDEDTLMLSVGMYLNDTSAVYGSYESKEENGVDVSQLSFNYKNVMAQANNTAINLETGLVYSDSDVDTQDYIALNVGADYYLNRQLSLGGRLDFTSVDDSSRDALGYTLSAQYFFNNQVAANLSYNSVDYDDDSEDEIVNVGVIARF
jgi:hypothetical protein